MIKTFKRKNDIGVDIEYTVIGKYKDKGNMYYIYTDFVSDDNKVGIRLFADIQRDGKLERLEKDKEKEIILNFNKEIMNYKIKV